MRRGIAGAFVTLFLLLTVTAATPGMFRGTIVEGPANSRSKGWIFVKGKNGLSRRVDVARASVFYNDEYPEEKRERSATSSLRPGTEVRVTATQGDDGEWHASEVEIVLPSTEKEMPAPEDPNRRQI